MKPVKEKVKKTPKQIDSIVKPLEIKQVDQAIE